ncbi:MAG: S-formylglutathione hydrolase [Oxalobacteraceae bacterium]|nr:MAG: S-formylglutathione hydrolase [Oxalobacteraceae bacterium]
MEQRSRQACFGGTMAFYTHPSQATGTTMRFGVFLPPQAERGPCPALYFLAGLTCTEETFAVKAGAQRYASEHGLVLVTPDTSPRGLDLPGETESWDFGEGAGFYVDATETPWAGHYNMATYVTQELPSLVEGKFPIDPARRGIFGHSMGGHGALVTALRDPMRWHSVSAIAPISNPVAVPWGQKAFSRYLGPNEASWTRWDASLLMREQAYSGRILVDQGLSDQFLERELHPEALEAAAAASGQSLTLRRQKSYDHSYWFIQSVIGDHIAHHARELGQ